MSKQSVSQIIEAIGADAICGKLDVSSHSVRHAKFTGSFSASWYEQIKALCDDAGVECPLSAFNFKSPSTSAPLSEAG